MMIAGSLRSSKRIQIKHNLNFDYVRRSRFLSFPMVIGAVMIGVVSGKAIFGPPLDEYWKKKLQEEASAEEKDSTST